MLFTHSWDAAHTENETEMRVQCFDFEMGSENP